MRDPKREGEHEHGFLGRRGFIHLCGGVAAALALGERSRMARAFSLGNLFGDGPRPRAVTPFITADEEFYLVAVNTAFRPGFGPDTVRKRWALELAGLGGDPLKHPLKLDYDMLVRQAGKTVLHTLECIGNPVGGTLIGNARWQVVPLRDLLRRLPGFSEARSVLFTGLDDYYASVSVERCLDDYAFLALGMNGVPLPAKHGFPARVLLPDLYGMEQPRWLKRIELQSDSKTVSYWQKFGWAGEVPVKPMSRFDPPGPLRAGKPATLTGIAYAGRRGVRAVEVSLDDGVHWMPCEFVDATTPDSWSRWRYTWPAPTSGACRLQVRVTDGHGAVQAVRRQGAFPDGASGYDRLDLDVSATANTA